MKLLLAFAVVFASLNTTNSYASKINMHDNGVSMWVQPVEMAVVMGGEIFLRSSVHYCPALPKGAVGEVYECYTSRERLSQFLNDTNILMLPDSELSKYLVAIQQTFDCANRSTPQVVTYRGQNVFWFSGLLLKKTRD